MTRGALANSGKIQTTANNIKTTHHIAKSTSPAPNLQHTITRPNLDQIQKKNIFPDEILRSPAPLFRIFKKTLRTLFFFKGQYIFSFTLLLQIPSPAAARKLPPPLFFLSAQISTSFPPNKIPNPSNFFFFLFSYLLQKNPKTAARNLPNLFFFNSYYPISFKTQQNSIIPKKTFFF